MLVLQRNETLNLIAIFSPMLDYFEIADNITYTLKYRFHDRSRLDLRQSKSPGLAMFVVLTKMAKTR